MRKSYVGSRSQKKQTDKNQHDIEYKSQQSSETSNLVEGWTVILAAHTQISNAPEDEAKERPKHRPHDREKAREKGDDFCDYPSNEPGNKQNCGPGCPAYEGMVTFMASSLKEAEEDEACRDRGIKHAQEDQCRNHKWIGHLHVDVIA